MEASPTTHDQSQPIAKWWKYRLELALFVGGLVVMNLIFLSKAFRAGDTVNREAAAQLGDFVGGYIGTLFSLAAVLLLVVTLKSQRDASQLESFENRLLELLKLHRDNVAELELQGSSGRKIFVLLTRELRSILLRVREVAAVSGQNLNQRQTLHVAYYCLFFGTGPNSSRMLKTSIAEFDPAFINDLDAALSDDARKREVARKFGYTPWEGHQSRLGHYYRHLYQTVSYVDQQRFPLDKYEYVKMVRAQLSTHEQALLLVNSLTPMGRNWWDKGLLVNYRMVQNIPRGFFNSETEIDLAPLFHQGYFEWEDSRGREAGQGSTVRAHS